MLYRSLVKESYKVSTKVQSLLLVIFFIGFLAPLYANPKQLEILTEHYPPFQILESDGKLTGKYVDIVNQVMALSQIKHKTRVLPWARAYRMAKATPNTCIYGIVRESFREKLFVWIGEVGSIEGRFYTSKEQFKHVKLTSLDDAYNYVIAVQRQGITTELLQRRGFVFQQQLLDVTDLDQAIHLVAIGRANLVVSNKDIINYYLKKSGLPQDTLVPLIRYVDVSNAKQYLACNIDTDPELVERLRAAYAQYRQEQSH